MLDDPDAPGRDLNALIAGSAERGLAALPEPGEEEDDAAEGDVMAPGENLAERLSTAERALLVSILSQEVEQAEAARKTIMDVQRRGLDRLGLDRTIESRSEPFEGASPVNHPALVQTMLDFAAMAMKEMAPQSGPARETPQDDGEMGERQARAGQAINAVYLHHIPEWRSEFDRLVMMLPMEGSSFLKTWWDGRRPRQAYVPCDQVILPYTDTGDPRTAPFIAHRLFVHQSETDANVASGMWLSHQPMADQTQQAKEVREKVDAVTGQDPVPESTLAAQFQYLEMAVYTAVPGLLGGKPHEYLATWEEATGTLVALRLNEDEDGERKHAWTHYKMFPWRGAYGLGLLHVLGGLTDAATGALRALLDSAHLSNTVTGAALGAGAMKNTAIDIKPFEIARIDAPPGVKDIRDVLMPLPFAGPSPVLFELLGVLGAQAKEFASVSMQRLAEGNPNMPVGTTLALVEEGAKIYSAIHERMYDARRGELEIVRGYVPAMIEDILPFVEDLQPEDLDDDVPVFPVSSPQAPSQMHRIAKAQAGLDLAAKAASVGVTVNWREAVREAGSAMGLTNLERLLPDPPPPFNADPYSETVAALKGAQLAVGPMDLHEEHVAAHAVVAVLPGVGQSPGGGALILHALEHAAEAAKMAGPMAMQVWQQLVGMVAPAMQPPDPTAGLIEVERAKVEARKEEIAAKTTAEITLTREEMQADLAVEEAKLENKKEEMAATLATKIGIAQQTNASQERIAAARLQGQKASAASRAAQLNAPGASGKPKGLPD